MSRLFFLFFGLLLISASVFSCTVRDDTGKIINLNKPAARIISLAPDLTEILFSIDAGNKIVGVMQGSDYPLQATHIPVVANYVSINEEAVLALHPDLIVAWDVGNTREQLQFFQHLQIPVYLTHPLQITDVAKIIKNVGCLTDKIIKSQHVAQEYVNRYTKLKNKFSHRNKVTVFYEVWPNPLMTISQGSWINQIITLCGGVNIFAKARGAAPLINLEAVLQANPHVIFSHSNLWQAWPTLHAVKTQHVYRLPSDLLERAGPRLLDGASEVCEALDRARKQNP